MSRKINGRLAEIKVAASLIEDGYELYLPLSDGSKYDIIAIKDGNLLRVSVKFTSERKPSGKWRVGLVQSSRRNGGKMHTTLFDKTEYDLLAVYIGPEDRVVLRDTSTIDARTEVSVA